MPQSIMIMVRQVVVDTYDIELNPHESTQGGALRAIQEAMVHGWQQFHEVESNVESEKIYYSTNDGKNWHRVEAP